MRLSFFRSLLLFFFIVLSCSTSFSFVFFLSLRVTSFLSHSAFASSLCSLFSRYMTQMCCDSTSREAFHRGMKVIFLKDATGTLNIANQAGSVKAKDLHTAILVTQQSAFSIVMTTKAWIDSLSSSSSPLLFVCIEEQGSATVPTRSPPVKFKIAIQRSSL